MDHKICFALSFLIFLMWESVYSQPDTLWTRIYGGQGEYAAHSILQTPDDGYILAGFTRPNGANNEDIYVLRTDSNGDSLWSKSYGGINDEIAYSIQPTSDNGYMITGWNEDNDDIFLLKINSIGDTLWTKIYGDLITYQHCYVARETLDGGFIIAGRKTISNSDAYLMKTDINGDTLWTRQYGGSESDQASDVLQLSDGGYIVIGSTTSFGAGDQDVFLFKVDLNGNLLWTKTYGGLGDEQGNSIQQTSDGGYIISAITNSYGAGNFDFYLIRTNSDGDTLWTRTHGGVNDDYGIQIQQKSDFGYITIGFTESFGAGAEDIYMVRTNSDGDSLWTKSYGWQNEETAYSFQLTSDGGYLIAGNTESFFGGNDAICLIKTQSDPTIIEDEINGLEIDHFTLYQNYPNPFNPITIISYSIPKTSFVKLSIYDLLGREIKTLLNQEKLPGNYKVEFDASSFSSGVYFSRLKVGDYSENKKMVLLK